MWTAIEIIGLWCIVSVPIGIVVAGLLRNDDEPEFVLVLVVPRSAPPSSAAGLGASDPAVSLAAVGGVLSREALPRGSAVLNGRLFSAVGQDQQRSTRG